MSGTVKTVLIVGAVGVGAYVLVTMLAPKPSTRTQPPPPGASGISVIGGFLGSALGALASSAGSKGAANQPTTSQPVAFTTKDIQGVEASDTATGVVGFGGWDS